MIAFACGYIKTMLSLWMRMTMVPLLVGLRPPPLEHCAAVRQLVRDV